MIQVNVYQSTNTPKWSNIPANNCQLGVGHELHAHRVAVEACLAENVHGAHQCGSAGLVVMKQVTPEKHHVCLVLVCKVKNLFKAAKRVICSYRILFPDPLMAGNDGCTCCHTCVQIISADAYQMIVGGYQYFEALIIGAVVR